MSMSDQKESIKKKNIPWSQIVITSLDTALFSLIVALLVFKYTTRKPKITYEIFPSSSFMGESKQFTIQNIRIQNEGDKEASEVNCVVSFPTSARIVDATLEASTPALSVNPSSDTTNFIRSYYVPMLNPGESVSFSFFIESYSGQGLEVAVRGSGVNGIRKTVDVNSPRIMLILVWLVTSLIILVIVVGYTTVSLNIKTKRIIDRGGQSLKDGQTLLDELKKVGDEIDRKLKKSKKLKIRKSEDETENRQSGGEPEPA